MKLSEVIAQVRRIQPGPYDERVLTAWVEKLEKMVRTEVIGRAEDAPEQVALRWPEDGETVLSAAAPYEDLYERYLYAMIDLANREYEAYGNSMAMFNATWDEFSKAYRRAHVPAQRAALKLRGEEKRDAAPTA